jgi:hypothetical protein
LSVDLRICNRQKNAWSFSLPDNHKGFASICLAMCRQRHIPISRISTASARLLRQQTEKRAIPPKRNHHMTVQTDDSHFQFIQLKAREAMWAIWWANAKAVANIFKI